MVDETTDDSPRYGHVLQAVVSTPWAILPEKLTVITELLALRATGARFTTSEVRDRIGAAATPSAVQRPSGSVAVLPLYGTLIPRGDMLSEMSGATSLERWTARFQQAAMDPSVSAIVLDIDSPGGSVAMVEETAQCVFNCRGQKPIVAVANSMAASAAYWIACQADELVCTPSGEVGSIGVFGAHNDMSAALAKEGITVSLISAGKFKTEGNPFEPLSAEARDAMQSRVDDYYAAFTRGVARGRGVSADSVRGGFGQGRVVSAKQAMQMGMVDQVATLDQTVKRVARGKRLDMGRMASAETDEPVDYNSLVDALAANAKEALADALAANAREEMSAFEANMARALIVALDRHRRRVRRRAHL